MIVSAVLDANVLFAGTTRALLVHLDREGLVRVHWSARILAETHGALVRTGWKTARQAEAHDLLLNAARPAALVPDEAVAAALARVAPAVRSPKDIHVAACALALATDRADVRLVTWNLRDFHRARLAALRIRLQTPDALLVELWAAEPARMAHAFRTMRAAFPSGPSVERVLDHLARDSSVKVAAALQAAHAAGQAVL